MKDYQIADTSIIGIFLPSFLYLPDKMLACQKSNRWNFPYNFEGSELQYSGMYVISNSR